MRTYWVGIAGEPTPDQRDRLGEAGMAEKGVSGDAFSRTIHRTYFLVDAPSQIDATNRIAETLPELREAWAQNPPHVIDVKDVG